MKYFILKYKMFLLILIITIFSILLITQSLAMTEYEKIDYNLGIVNTDYLNMRSGSNINFDAIDLLTKNEYVRNFITNHLLEKVSSIEKCTGIDL